MKANFYLTINSRGSVSVTKNRPGHLRFDEVSVACNIELPDMLFKKPQISASIVVSDNDAMPFTIDADTSNNVRDAIEAATGIQVKLTIENRDALSPVAGSVIPD